MTKNKPKGQHFVPACYLREWIDILPPRGRIWIFSKDGKKKRNQRPEKVFISNDLYTIEFKGKKNYIIEKSLSNLEGEYATIFREKIKKHIPINEKERIILSMFVAAMFLRTPKYKENTEKLYDQLIQHAESFEQANGLGNNGSERLKEEKNNVHQFNIVQLLPEITKLLNQMNVAFLCAGFGAKFITSDNPCNLFNPDLQWQNFRGPGLLDKNIEVSLPLSPNIFLCLSWSNLRGYIKWKKADVEEANRKTVGHCHKEFISHNRFKKRMWFRRYPMDIFFILKILNNRFKIYLHKFKIWWRPKYYGRK